MRPRLEAIFDAIPPDAGAVADIGYDLGNLLVALLSRRRTVNVVGVEVQPGARERFLDTHAAVVAEAGPRLTLRTGDGLTALSPGDVEGVAIAGIGAHNIAAMLRAAPEVVAALDWLVLCPPRFDGVIRPALYELGFHPSDERLVRDRGHTYEVIVARPGPEPTTDPVARAFGPRLFERRDPALVGYLEELAASFAGAYDHALADYRPGSRKAALGAKLRSLPDALARARAFTDG
ncbi:MAG: SAM-dependent methyltransferase [Deltaproteobacteria bacterium]|nr:MAG: SAM-dependent methyltransferase [Deltaproteobacteria bacterium]